MTILFVALGGATGSVLRYLLGGMVQTASHARFPVGTLAVNVIGCIVAGLLFRTLSPQPEHASLRAALIVGFCGGFTTFSAFSLETVGMITGGEWLKAGAYVLVSVGAGLLGTAIALQ